MEMRAMPLVLLLALALGPVATAQTDAPSDDSSQAKQLEYLEAMKKWQSGAPIPPARVSDVKEMWYAAREAERRKKAGEEVPAKPSKTLEELTPEQFGATQFRWMLLGSLFERGVLKDYTNREERDVLEKVFCAAATMPFTMKDWDEAAVRLLAAPDKKAEELRALGYNPEKPVVDEKFLDWLRGNCR